MADEDADGQFEALRLQQISELAAKSSMCYSRGGKIHNCIPMVCSHAAQAEKMAIEDSGVRDSRDAFLKVTEQYREGLELLNGQRVRPGDAAEFQQAFIAGLTGDDELIDKVGANIGARLAEIEAHKQAGHIRIDSAGDEHERFWETEMLPHVLKTSGPVRDDFPLTVSVARAATTANSGIAIKNGSNAPLSNVCIALRSTIGSSGLQDDTHYIYIKSLKSHQEVLSPMRFAEGVILPVSNPEMGKTVEVALWSAEVSSLVRIWELPKDISIASRTKRVRKQVQWAPFRLTMTQLKVGQPEPDRSGTDQPADRVARP